MHCNQDDGDDEECNGGDPMFSNPADLGLSNAGRLIRAVLPRAGSPADGAPQSTSRGRKSACYTLTLATAYRMLFGHDPHRLKPSDNVLVWGASGGLGVFAVQLCAATGANAIGVISDESKRDYVMSLGAKGVINRKDFECWGSFPRSIRPSSTNGPRSARFGKAIWDITGQKGRRHRFRASRASRPFRSPALSLSAAGWWYFAPERQASI